MLLKTKKLMKAFGGLKAIDKIDIEIPQGEIRGIIGPNGSGKSTFFNLISGVYDLTRPLYKYQLLIFGLTIVLTILFMPKGIGGFIDRYFLEKRFKKKTGTEKT